MTTIQKHSKLNTAGSSQVNNCIQCSPDSPPRIENVINQYHFFSLNPKRDLRFTQNRLRRNFRKIIPIEVNIKLPYGHLNTSNLLEATGKPPCQGYPPFLNANKNEIVSFRIFLQDLMSNSL